MLVKYIGLSGGFNLVLILFEKQFRWWVAKACSRLLLQICNRHSLVSGLSASLVFRWPGLY